MGTIPGEKWVMPRPQPKEQRLTADQKRLARIEAALAKLVRPPVGW